MKTDVKTRAFDSLRKAIETKNTSNLKWNITIIITAGFDLSEEESLELAHSIELLAKFVENDVRKDIADRVLSQIR